MFKLLRQRPAVKAANLTSITVSPLEYLIKPVKAGSSDAFEPVFIVRAAGLAARVV